MRAMMYYDIIVCIWPLVNPLEMIQGSSLAMWDTFPDDEPCYSCQIINKEVLYQEV